MSWKTPGSWKTLDLTIGRSFYGILLPYDTYRTSIYNPNSKHYSNRACDSGRPRNDPHYLWNFS